MRSAPQEQHPAPQQQPQTRDTREEERKAAAAAAAQDKSNREAAELIVNEERITKNKMPSYKGLEDYTLLDKMGEYVKHSRLYPL